MLDIHIYIYIYIYTLFHKEVTYRFECIVIDLYVFIFCAAVEFLGYFCNVSATACHLNLQ